MEKSWIKGMKHKDIMDMHWILEGFGCEICRRVANGSGKDWMHILDRI